MRSIKNLYVLELHRVAEVMGMQHATLEGFKAGKERPMLFVIDDVPGH